MNAERIEKIANAVLYEGYLLYPYRSSAVKNQQRFNFGVLYPRAHCEQNPGSDAWEMQTECLVHGSGDATIEIKTRFLAQAYYHVGDTDVDDDLATRAGFRFLRADAAAHAAWGEELFGA